MASFEPTRHRILRFLRFALTDNIERMRMSRADKPQCIARQFTLTTRAVQHERGLEAMLLRSVRNQKRASSCNRIDERLQMIK